MKNKLLKVISFSLSLSILISLLTGCSSKYKATAVKTKAFADLKQGQNELTEGVITQNDRFTMGWNSTYSQVIITDNQTNAVYSTMPTDAMDIRYDADGFEIINNIQIESPIVVYYYNPDTLSENQAYGSLDAITDGEIFTEKITDGVRVTYVFTSQEISVPVDYILKDESFSINIDTTEIRDNGEFFVTGVAVAPFLCSLSNSAEESYLVIPDGSGAVIEPQVIDHIGRQGSKRVYGDDITVNSFTLTSYEEKINMPIFGKKQGDNGILGIITSSAERAYINWDIGSNAKGYSSVYPFFRIRGYDVIKRPAGFMMSLSEIPIFDDYIIAEPLTVEYFPLGKENADYSGMAETYREYLIDNNLLKKQESSDYKAVLRVLGAAEQKIYNLGVPSTELTPLTTVSEAMNIAEYFNENIDGKLLMNLVGFGQSGLDVGKVGGGFKIASELGGKKDIEKLKDYCVNNGLGLFMDFDILGFNKSGSGFSESDTAKAFDGQTVYLDFYSNITRNETTDQKYMLLSRNKLSKAAEKAVHTAQDYSFDGISLSSLSNTAYSDYGVENCGLSGGVSQDVTSIYKEMSKDTAVISSNANSYAAALSDFIIETPNISSGYDITLYDIPFYQIVFKGYIPMSSTSLNLSVDSKTAALRCIETGIIPTFTLSYEYDNSFIQSKFSSINVSSYEGLRSQITETVEEISVVTDRVGNSEIENHTVLDDSLRITEFSNGVKIAVNYGDKPIDYGGNTVAAKDYIMWEE